MYFDVGIDIGTTNTKMYFRNSSDIICIPSVIAVHKKKGKIVGVGETAYKMIGKTPDFIMVKETIKKGLVSDLHLNKILINEFLSKRLGKTIRRLKVCLNFHSFMSDLDKLAFKNSIFSSEYNKLYLIDESLASAVGSYIDFSSERYNLIVNVGGGTTDISIISPAGIVLNNSIQIGGEDINEIIKKNLYGNYNFLIGKTTTEKIKKDAITLENPSDQLKYTIKGKDVLTRLPKTQEFTQKQICEGITKPINIIIENLKEIIKLADPDAVSSIQNTGIILTGGSSLILGFKEMIENQLKIKVKTVENPINCVAYGALNAFNVFDSNLSSQFVIPA